jgi:hypothetical protein
MPLRGFIAALVFAIAGGPAFAADPFGYGEAFDTLYSVDLVTHQASEIGRATPVESGFRYANVEGLTFSPAGTLYAVSDAHAVKTLLTIDRGTGLATAIGTLDLGTDQELDLGLAFTCDGALWMSASTGDLWRVDPQQVTATHIGNLGVTVTGLAARGSVLYAAGGQGNNNLYRVNTTTAQATPVGTYGSNTYITATSPGFDGTGQLWAVLDYVPPQHDSDPVAEWSDLAQLSSAGALNDLGAIMPSLPQWSIDLQYIGLRGLAIPSGICAPAGPAVTATPALSWRGITGLLVLIVLVSGTRLRRSRSNI